MKASLLKNRAELFDALIVNPSGAEWCGKYAQFADSVIRELFAKAGGNSDSPIAIVATGGYGRRELSPKSDLDISFIALDEGDPAGESLVRDLFRSLVDTFSALDTPLGYAYRVVGDCPALDPVTRTGLMDARLICGNRDVFRNFEEAFWESFPLAEFLISKIDERSVMRKQWHNTPFVVDFQLKEGVGGLRDFHASNWISRALGLKFDKSTLPIEFLLTVRNVLHLTTGKKQDQLVRTRIGQIADLMKMTPQSLASKLFEEASFISRRFDETQRQIEKAAFALSPGAVARLGEIQILSGANVADAAVGVSRGTRLGFRATPIKGEAELGDGSKLMEIITQGIQSLRAMEVAGVLALALPELEICKYLLPTDSVHTFTVGEHSMRVVEKLEQSKGQEDFRVAWDDISDSRSLFLAALLHDVGKAIDEPTHSQIGATIVGNVCERFSVSGDKRETAIWLVENHLELARIARTHDIDHPQTHLLVSKLCERTDRLAMLYLLTYADIAAVSDQTWTPQVRDSLSKLFEKSRSLIGSERIQEDDAIFREQAMRKLQTSDTDSDARELMESMATHYLLSTPIENFALHADYVRRAREGETIVSFSQKPEAGVTEITFVRHDLEKPGLLSRVLGVIYSLDCTLHSARAASTSDLNPVAIDTLNVSFQKAPLPQSLCRIVSAELKRCTENMDELLQLLKRNGKDPKRRQEFFTYRFQPGDLGVVEIETPLGRGMPFRITKMLAEFGWNVNIARIGQWADRAIARFYVDKPGGVAITADEVQENLGKAFAASIKS